MPEQPDERIAAVLRRIAELPNSAPVTSEHKLKADLGIDSLMLIDVVVQLEADLDIDLGDDFTENIITVGDLQRHIGGVRSN
jgi:acyl carrier protein